MSGHRIHPRRGITLIELLVVVFIMLLITAIAIPMMAPSLEERRLRETSRLVTSYLTGARTRAIQTGRPFGVIIETLPGQDAAGITLSYAEVQAPYAGDTITSVARLTLNTTLSPPQIMISSLDDGAGANPPTSSIADQLWRGLLRPGDLIKFNYQGHLYAITVPATSVDADGYISVAPNPADAASWWTITPTGTTSSLPQVGAYAYQIFRQPKKTAAAPMQLPEGMVIDLNFSGNATISFLAEPYTDANGNSRYDSGELFTDVNGNGVWDGPPFILLFSSNGSLTSVFSAHNSFPIAPTGPVHLLMGSRVNVPSNLEFQNNPSLPNFNPIEFNYQDLTNFWVTIHHQTGLITPSTIGGDANNNGTISLIESRKYADEAYTIGGR